MNKRIVSYRDGERNCPICGEQLPAHQTWPGARYRFCGKPDCVTQVKRLPRGEYIEASERKCDGFDCNNFLPEGTYDRKAVKFYCSAICWLRNLDGAVRKCGCGCDTLFIYKGTMRGPGPVFLSSKHAGAYFQNLRLTEACGPFKPILDEYLHGFAALRYRNLKSIRASLRTFFLFLNLSGVASLEDVSPSVVTQFMLWAPRSGHGFQPSNLSSIKVFFDWMIAEQRRESANPVISKIHLPPKKYRLPRPLPDEELEFMWRLLLERGNARLRFAASAAEEGGLRVGEICNLRLEDVDPTRKRFFVRLPNKTNRERWAPFGDKTKRYFIEWMAERNPDCGHDRVIHSIRGLPVSYKTFSDEFRRVLCKTVKGEQVNETGFENWSTHRLRHNMATKLIRGGADAATVMASGGWRSYQAMAGYAKVEAPTVYREYDQAMLRSKEQKNFMIQRTQLTPSELLRRMGHFAPKPAEASFEISKTVACEDRP